MKKLTCFSVNMLTLIVTMLFLTIHQQALAQTSYKVTANKLNVRATPSTNGAVIGTLAAGTVITPLNISKGWAKINYKNKLGYVNADYLEKKGTEAKAIAKTRQSLSANAGKVNTSRTLTTQKKVTYKSQLQRQSKWLFSLGAMPHSTYEEGLTNLSWMAMLGGDFPVTISGCDLSLETGLRYMNLNYGVKVTDYIYSSASLLEIPVLLCYDLQIADNLSLRFGAGPYFSYLAESGGGLMIGLEPKVVAKYKNVGLGVHFSAPLYKGFDGEKKNFPMLTLNFTFGGKTWKHIATGLEAVGQIGQSVLDSGLLSSNQEVNTQKQGDYIEQQNTDYIEIDGIYFTPEEEKRLKEIEKLVKRKKEKAIKYGNLSGSLNRMKASVKANEYYSEEQKLQRESLRLLDERSAIYRHAKERMKTGIMTPTYQHYVDEEKIKEEEEKAEKKVAERNASNFRSERGQQLSNWYSRDRSTIHQIKIGSASYRYLSISERRKLIQECQKRMKEYRKEYEKYAGGQTISGADKELENWKPTNSELTKGMDLEVLKKEEL